MEGGLVAEGVSLSFSIGAVSRVVGVAAQTLRLWEREGLIEPRRTEGGYRVYGEADVERLRKIKRLRKVEGWNIAAIRKQLGPIGSTPHHNGVASSGGGRVSGVPGKRLRHLRVKARMILREVSEATGLSISFISSLERGNSGASVVSLRLLAEAYGVTMRELLGTDLGQNSSLVRQKDRPVMRWDNGVCFEEIALGEKVMDPSYVRVPSRAGSEGFYSHDGEKFIHVISGILSVELEGQGYFRLEPGDTLYFASTVPHRWWAEDDPVEAIHVNTPPTF
jgi:DNA-binding transcriptional MerR regulator/mannose-6-phosphate isomerase-like protein (cupin superfamily)